VSAVVAREAEVLDRALTREVAEAHAYRARGREIRDAQPADVALVTEGRLTLLDVAPEEGTDELRVLNDTVADDVLVVRRHRR